ncbi:MAG: bifunctional (p)ppGpp synthetase/guanosine-3',5'-bis(diphosphate) 3'-pyrophosphohydrolase [Deltaproteobacteria bacterium]|nr:MAG: bifunctional (p)ppGpp synthetase/guanosine-3',5'-bis(diphosphate) 3'-pyrophosphohydrolase [Deltaproteobacteria bacterium]
MTLGELVAKVHSYHPEANTDLMARAYAFSERMHQGQKRRSGDPYFVHPVEVAKIITDMKLDIPSVVTGLLHDTVEDTLTSLEQIEKEFGLEIATLVDGVTKISQINFTTREERQAENFRKMIIAMARDIRVILIKLADRAHNMRTLSYLPEAKQREIAEETLEIYAPLAHRLGIYWLKSELEDEALRALRPEVYAQLKQDVAKKKAEREHYIAEVIAILQQILGEAGIKAEVYGRPKHFYSIYQKMQSQNLPFSQIYDLVAFRIMVDSVPECYAVLGIVHSHWKPVPGRFKDYIALPKANLYQSLHTTVIGPYGERIEVQIRTHEIHRVAEEGIAAHWTYKEGRRGLEETQRFAWLRQLVEWQQQLKDPQEFLHTIKEDLFPEEVYVFTPKGDLYSFPKGASVIDFAYRIHSQVGNHCTGARVNGRLVPLRYQLQNGDTLEIITTAQQTPSKDWLKVVQTSKARARIRQWIKAQQRERSVALGRELLERELSRYHLDLAALRKQDKIAAALTALSFKDEETLLAAIGYGQVTVGNVLSYFVPQQEPVQGQTADAIELDKIRQKPVGEAKGGVRVGGLGDVLVRFGRCCNPLPGEPIRGVITRGRGVTVHTGDCQRLLESDPQRHVAVSWDNGAKYVRPIKIEVLCEDWPGLLAAMSKAISAVGINIASADVRTLPDKRARDVFEVMVASAEDLERVMRNLERVRGVVKVARINT